jgi:hypothetical protein
MLKTVYDLIRPRMTLQVIRTNCDNTGTLNHRYLTARFDMGMVLAQIRFSSWPTPAPRTPTSPRACAPGECT